MLKVVLIAALNIAICYCLFKAGYVFKLFAIGLDILEGKEGEDRDIFAETITRMLIDIAIHFSLGVASLATYALILVYY